MTDITSVIERNEKGNFKYSQVVNQFGEENLSAPIIGNPSIFYPPLGLEVEELTINEGEYLSDALSRQGYENLPSNRIINKFIPGCGATYGELHSKRHSIIVEPFLPVILDKAGKTPDALPVYKETTVKQIISYINDSSITYRKFITTPESFSKMVKAHEKLGLDVYSIYFCLVDESEHNTDDSDYRKSIASFMTLSFFRFVNKSTISATPLEPSEHTIGLFHKHGFRWLNIRPTFDYREDITIIATHSFYPTVRNKIQELINGGSKCILIFYASTTGLNKIVLDLIDKKIINEEQYDLFCAENSVEKSKEKLLINSHSDIQYPLRLVNGFTSKFFAAVDMDIEVKCDIIMLSNYSEAKHTLLDPHTNSIQIQGRPRTVFEDGKRYNSLTAIVAFGNSEIKYQTPEEISLDIRTREQDYNLLHGRLNSASNPTEKNRIIKDLKGLGFNEIIDDSTNIINPFMIAKMFRESVVRSYYSSIEHLVEAYHSTDFFNVTFITLESFGEDDVNRLLASPEAKRKELIVKAIATKDQNTRLLIQSRFSGYEWLINAVDILGSTEVLKVQCKKTEVEHLIKDYNISMGNAKRFSKEFLHDIENEFHLDIGTNELLDAQVILDRMEHIFDKHNIIISRRGKHQSSINTMHKLTAKTIEDYFEIRTDKKNGNRVKLIRFIQREEN